MTAPAGAVAAVPSTGESPRHPWCDQFCAYLERAARSRALDAIAAARPANSPGTLILLPVFAWLPPAIPVGRKTRNAGGPDFTLPVRLEYPGTGEALVLRPGQARTVTVRARGMGHDFAGAVTVASAPGQPSSTSTASLSDLGLPDRVDAGVTVSVRRAVAGAAEDAALARWEAVMGFLLPWAEREADAAVSLLRSSAGTGFGPVPERVRDAVIDKLAYGITRAGDAGRPAGSPLLRLVDRCCEPGAFRRADPARLVAVAIRRDAMDAAQSVTGDTRMGPRLRDLAGEIGPQVTPPVLASEANERRLYARTVTERRARIALDYRLPSEEELPPEVTGCRDDGEDRP